MRGYSCSDRGGISATAVCPGFARHGGIYDRMVNTLAGTKNSSFAVVVLL